MNEFLKIGDHEENVDRTRQAKKLSVLFYPRSLHDLLFRETHSVLLVLETYLRTISLLPFGGTS